MFDQQLSVTTLTIICARRGSEPARFQIYQWNEVVNGERTIKEALPDKFDKHSMLITYQTGEGANHLVSIMFTSETIQAMKYLTDEQIRREAGVNEKNMYVFASTKQSTSHASGWHCINEILKCLNLKGALNATKIQVCQKFGNGHKTTYYRFGRETIK